MAAQDAGAVALEGMQHASGRRVPDLCGLVRARGHHTTAIRGESNRIDGAKVPGEREQFLAALGIPNPRHAIFAPGDQPATIG